MIDVREEWVKLLKSVFPDTKIVPVYPKDFKILPIISYNINSTQQVASNKNDWDRYSKNRIEYEFYDIQLDFWTSTIYDTVPMIRDFDEALEDNKLLGFSRYYTSPDIYDGQVYHRIARYKATIDIAKGVVYSNLNLKN